MVLARPEQTTVDVLLQLCTVLPVGIRSVGLSAMLLDLSGDLLVENASLVLGIRAEVGRVAEHKKSVRLLQVQ